MGGGGGSDNSQNNWLTMQLMQQWQDSAKATATATQQQMGGLQLDWLRNYGQTSAMKAAGIPSPFSTVTGGFQNPFASTAGRPTAAAVAGAPPSAR
jgi:hypothetical protein